MTGFELWTSDVGSNRSINRAMESSMTEPTTTAQYMNLFWRARPNMTVRLYNASNFTALLVIVYLSVCNPILLFF